MPFDLSIDVGSEQFNWFDLPESDRARLEMARDKFNTIQYHPAERLLIHGPDTVFDEQYTQITSIRIYG